MLAVISPAGVFVECEMDHLPALWSPAGTSTRTWQIGADDVKASDPFVWFPLNSTDECAIASNDALRPGARVDVAHKHNI